MIKSGTCSSDNNEDGFVVFDRCVMAGIGFIVADVIRESFRLRRRYGRDK
jgi:hypothetical protein